MNVSPFSHTIHTRALAKLVFYSKAFFCLTVVYMHRSFDVTYANVHLLTPDSKRQVYTNGGSSLESPDHPNNVCLPRDVLLCIAGAWRRREIAATLFRKYYVRGDLPICVDHRANGNAIRWKIRPTELDFHVYLPIFFDGLREVRSTEIYTPPPPAASCFPQSAYFVGSTA